MSSQKRVRELSAMLSPLQREWILEHDELVDPFGSLRTPTELGRAVMAHVKSESSPPA